MNIPLISLILQGIPELAGVVTLAFVIKGIPLKWTRIIPIAIVLAVVSYIVRLLPIPFGLHTIFIIILLFIFMLRIDKEDISLSLLACLISLLCLVMFETVSLFIQMTVFGVTPDELYSNQVIRIVLGEPHVILLFTFAFLLKKFYFKKGRAQ